MHDSVDQNPGHPPVGHLEPVDDDAVLEPDVVQQRDPATNHLLQQGPGHAEDGSPPVALRAVAAGLVDPGAGAVDPDRAQPLELIVDPGEPVDQQVQAGLQQQMQVLSLGHATPRRGGVGEPLPLHDDDLVDEVGQYPRGQEPRDARTDDDGGRHPASLTYACGQEKVGALRSGPAAGSAGHRWRRTCGPPADQARADALGVMPVECWGNAGGRERGGRPGVRRPVESRRHRLRQADSNWTTLNLVECDDMVICHNRWSGTYGGTVFRGVPTSAGNRFAVEHIHMHRMVDHQIADHWVVRDDLGMLMQIGAITAGARASSERWGACGARDQDREMTSRTSCRACGVPLVGGVVGAACRNRTDDLLITSETLYRLS